MILIDVSFATRVMTAAHKANIGKPHCKRAILRVAESTELDAFWNSHLSFLVHLTYVQASCLILHHMCLLIRKKQKNSSLQPLFHNFSTIFRSQPNPNQQPFQCSKHHNKIFPYKKHHNRRERFPASVQVRPARLSSDIRASTRNITSDIVKP